MSKKNGDLKIVYRPVSGLIAYARNPRTHSPKQIAQIIDSIKEFGWTNPVLIDPEGGIIAGHGRVLAAQRLGLETLPCIVLAGLTDAQKRAYLIADNRLALNAGWDTDLLTLELVALKEADFDLDLMGFTDKEIAALLVGKNKAAPAQMIPITAGADLKALAPTPEEMDRLKDREIIVEFSGGKDSSAATVWAKHFLPDAKMKLVYIDLGAEHTGFYLHLQKFAEAIGLPLKVIRTKENIFALMLQKNEWPYFIGPYCHDLLHAPLYDLMHTYEPGKVAMIRGGRLKEKAAHSKPRTSRFMELDRLKGYTIFQPLYFTEKETTEGIVLGSGLPIWEGYGQGLLRTACRICPGQRPATYAAIRASFPDIWAELMELERRFGPGCWQRAPGPGLHCSLADMADKGEEIIAGRLSQEDSEFHDALEGAP
jgi:ParB-like chromosome segregation protein Spo0J